MTDPGLLSRNPTLTVGSLFSGIGGLDLGLERAGMTIRWQCEVDEFCSRVLAKHWPDVPNLGDVTKVDWSNVERVDLVCGGFPCQPVSRAGKRLAQQDERWLWPEYARALRSLRPRFVLVENVPGLLARGFGDVAGDLAALGYGFEWECIPAAAVGAPHIRDRVWIVAHTDRVRRDGWPGAQRSDGWTQPADSGRVVDTCCGRHRSPEGAVFARRRGPEPAGWWAVEPDVGRVAAGVPSRVDRLRALGNAVVPQVAEWIGRQIMECAA